MAAKKAQQHEFKTEIKQILDLIIHSLYSNKEIFLRELVSNACDAIDKVRFESLTNTDILEGNAEWKIKIARDEKKKTLTVSDNGIGMSAEGIADHLGTIAKSGTKEFLQQLQKTDAKSRPELIGQFGVGFYSAYMVADKVTVVSRMAGGKGVKWESDGQGSFTVEETEKETRGTDVIVHLKKDEKEFLDEWKIRQLVKKYSDFIEHPIVMDVEKTDDKKKKTVEEETLNSQKAIWLRSKSEVKEEEYNEFYKHVGHDMQDPARVIHYAAEGAIEFKALLFLPAKKPFDLFWPEAKNGLQLYIQRVFIMDDCKDLLPEYLRFVKGVVDASDLPLNVSREMLQHNAMLDKIRKNLVSRIIKELTAMQEKEREKYEEFYREFGAVIKEGVHSDWENKEKLADLVLYETMNSDAGKLVSLKEYVDAAPKEQDEIYYLAGEVRQRMEKAPYLEAFKTRGQDVLFMVDPIDEWVVQGLPEYKKKKLKAVDKGEIKQGKVEEVKKEEHDKAYKGLIVVLKEKLGEVKDIRLSSRLTDSASCLVADDDGMSAHMEKIMKRMGPDMGVPENKKILELNPTHPVVEALRKIYEGDVKDERVADYGRLLYEQAVIAEGSPLADPVGFAQRLNKLMLKDTLIK